MLFFFMAVLAGAALWAQPTPVARKPKLNPYQTTLLACLNPAIDVSAIDTHKKLYKAIESYHPLLTSEMTYRETLYRQKGELKKLRFENGAVQVFAVDDDENLTLLSSEKVGPEAQAGINILRHRPLSAEARIQQLLIRADIRSDFSKVKEVRAGKVVMTISWSKEQIKSLLIEFGDTKKSLNCTQKENTDICSCNG